MLISDIFFHFVREENFREYLLHWLRILYIRLREKHRRMLKVFTQKKTDSIPFVYEYLLSLPIDYDNDRERKWPLLLFLHGAGESHPPIDKIRKHGPPKLLDQYSSNSESARFLAENFLTCSPQVNQGYGWNNQVLVDLLDQIEQDYRIDQTKIYCTGISMGKSKNISLFDIYSSQVVLEHGHLPWINRFVLLRLFRYVVEVMNEAFHYSNIYQYGIFMDN